MTAKEKLIDAFFSLLTIKDFQSINISELCNLAKVHRTTFYAYYDNLLELLEDAKNYAIQKFLNKKITKNSEDDFLSFPILIPYLNFIKSNKNLYIAYLNNSHAFEADKDFERIYQEVFLQDALRKYKDIDEWLVRKITEFFINGIVGLIKSWLQNGCKESTEQIAKVIVTIRNLNYKENKE